ncbi:MAG TPA: response regulator transcription factor [Candidatus Borkfalkia avistercoris]|uniref:Stage 0 sporulation protein A homolog n=1 Tax=Candidatus Borkfalkia avistercoris TaxID=2838504 RepID=A0A9D2D022_9FIRM|nr:response regulator transcription factor [Candidatus Borkfalkia avistercoris]
MKIKVMIVDDQPILSEGIKSVLSTSAELEVVAVATDGADALEKMEGNVPDVVLLDIRMPNMNGVVATGEIKKRFPDTKVLILTTFDDSDYILSALNNGACGYLLKDIGGAALIDAVKNAYAGDTILPAKIAKKISDAAKNVSADRELKLKKAFGLSERETEIAVMLYEGFNNRQIASALNLSEGTSRNYISAIYMKLGCDNRADAIKKMRETISG